MEIVVTWSRLVSRVPVLLWNVGRSILEDSEQGREKDMSKSQWNYPRKSGKIGKKLESVSNDAAAPVAPADAGVPIEYDDVVRICDAHGIVLPVEHIETVVEIIRHFAPTPAAADAARSGSAAYRPSEPAVRAACDLLDKIKRAYDHWEGWSGTPGACNDALNLLRYGSADNPSSTVAADTATYQPIGEAGPMPGASEAWTIAVFKADEVPTGTQVYIRK